MIEKTLSTFHPVNIVLQQQYRNSKYQKYSELSEVLSVAEQQNEVLMSNHSTRPTGSIVVPEAHVTVVERSRNRKWGRERGNGRGKEVPCSKARGKGRPRVDPNPRRKEVIIVGKSRENAIDAEQGDIGPADAAPPNTSLASTNRARIRGKVNMSPTSSLSLKLRSVMT
jgi:hypothetical protein